MFLHVKTLSFICRTEVIIWQLTVLDESCIAKIEYIPVHYDLPSHQTCTLLSTIESFVEYYDTFERPVDAIIHSARWYDGYGPGTGHDVHDCITHYDSDNKWVNRACTDSKHIMCMYEGKNL